METRVKRSLVRLGVRSSERVVHYLNGALDYIELGRWLRLHGFAGGLRLASALAVFGAIADTVAAEDVLYLQFGAQDAAMLAAWAGLLSHPGAKFEIFDPDDTFDGTWLPVRGRGHWWAGARLDAEARMVALQSLLGHDERIRYVAGPRLEELLDGYRWPKSENVVVVFDTDHYAATRTALRFVAQELPLGSYIFFDQLNHRADEMRAFHEFLLESDVGFELFAANRILSCVAFRRVR